MHAFSLVRHTSWMAIIGTGRGNVVKSLRCACTILSRLAHIHVPVWLHCNVNLYMQLTIHAVWHCNWIKHSHAALWSHEIMHLIAYLDQ